MLARLRSAAVFGIDAFGVDVEVDVCAGLPVFNMVGLPDASVRESRDRVRSAIRNSGFEFPLQRITINLAPADVRKGGSSFDLPIALGIMAATGMVPARDVQDWIVVGELSLDGGIHGVRGVLPIAAAARRSRAAGLVLPAGNVEEAAVVGDLPLRPVETLRDAVAVLRGGGPRAPAGRAPAPTPAPSSAGGDLAEVRGQAMARRALEIAAAGGHSLLLVGSPGVGKTMLARRLGGVLPPLTHEEALEVTTVHSVAGLLPSGVGLLTERPFRAPHHTISGPALVGGGPGPRPGEISLAHHGVLFLDEMPEFDRRTLEMLRQPLEAGKIQISRAARAAVFPARFSLVAAMNPCPCGYRGDEVRPCRCTPLQIDRYRGRVSGPLLDRIDLTVRVQRVVWAELGVTAGPEPEGSAEVRARVMCARRVQDERYAGRGARVNADLHGAALRRHCAPDAAGARLLERAVDRFGLSARGYHRVLRVARTIADLAGSTTIGNGHIAEALQFRADIG